MVYPSTGTGTGTGILAVHVVVNTGRLPPREYSSRFVLCCFVITVYQCLFKQQDLETVIKLKRLPPKLRSKHVRLPLSVG